MSVQPLVTLSFTRGDTNETIEFKSKSSSENLTPSQHLSTISSEIETVRFQCMDIMNEILFPGGDASLPNDPETEANEDPIEDISEPMPED